MKPINCPLEERKNKSYLRFVNKDTLEYVDMPCVRGQNVSIFCDLLKNADCYSGNYSYFSGDKKKATEYHYMMLITLNSDDHPSFFMRRGKLFTASVDPDTNELLEANDIPEFYDYELTKEPQPIEAIGISIIKENGKYYKYRTLYVPKDGKHVIEKVSKRIIPYDKIFI